MVAQPPRASRFPTSRTAKRFSLRTVIGEHVHVHEIVCRRASGDRPGVRPEADKPKWGPALRAPSPARSRAGRCRARAYAANVRTAIEAGAPEGAARAKARGPARCPARTPRVKARAPWWCKSLQSAAGAGRGSFDNSSSTGFSTVSEDGRVPVRVPVVWTIVLYDPANAVLCR